MSLKTIDQHPTIDDTILFNLYTTNTDGDRIDPYKVDSVTIYFLERNYNTSNLQQYDYEIQNHEVSYYYKNLIPVKKYGTEDFPAWLSSDTSAAFLTKVDYDENGDPEVGHFQLEWNPELIQEGDYFICHKWTGVANGDSLSYLTQFYLAGEDRRATVPSHQTDPLKYTTLLDRYTPEYLKTRLMSSDITPEVIRKTNSAFAMLLTDLENLVNQIVDLQDANVVKEVFLPYLAGLFKWKLKSLDTTLWRRQVKSAINLYKRKGTLGGLIEALASIGVTFKGITYYWQIVSPSTWQEAFEVSASEEQSFYLSKLAILPEDTDNFHFYIKRSGEDSYEEQDLSDVSFATVSGTNDDCEDNTPDKTLVTWNGTEPLAEGDWIRIIYKISEPTDQALENYIQTLPLADQRSEEDVTAPLKNWNVRLIGEDDPYFDVICTQKHPFVYPVVYGKVRTQFPYSENIYNMEEYNGSRRDSTNPCDLDNTFYDVCSFCRSSKISLDLSIENLSDDRLTETEELVRDFLPFHAVLHTITYSGLNTDIITPPLEEIECLVHYRIEENFLTSQYDFNRIVEDGLNFSGELERDMLSTATVVATGTDGVGSNLSYSIYSPGIDFSELGIDNDDNLLEILSGDNEGEYSVTDTGTSIADVQGSVTMDESGFPFRLSNIRYQETGASVYQDNLFYFEDVNEDLSSLPIPPDATWDLEVLTGPNAGTYPVNEFMSNGKLSISGWGGGNVSSLNWQLLAPGSIVVANGTSGEVSISYRGRLEIPDTYDIRKGDYAAFDSNQYVIISSNSSNVFYINGYSGGTSVGSINLMILRRLADSVGYIKPRGMILTTTANYETALSIQNGQNPISPQTETSDFKENYLILIGNTYYQMSDIDGQTIYLGGNVEDWGSGTNVSYSIIHFENEPIVTQSGLSFEFMDRRGGEELIETQINSTPLLFRMNLLNKIKNGGTIEQPVQTQEFIRCKVITKN